MGYGLCEKFLFEKEINIFGIRRSGMHAIVSWLFGHFKLNEISYINNSNLSLRKSLRPTDLYVTENTKYFITTIEHELPSKIIDCVSNIDSLFNVARDEAAEEFKCDKFSKYQYNIILLRDYRNNLASGLKNWGARYLKQGDFAKLWLEYAKEIVSSEGINNKVPVIFDRWFVDKEYRAEISNKLNIEFKDDGINDVCRYGSSFDSTTFDGKAQEMDVLGRWKEYKEENWFWEILPNEAEDIWNRIRKNWD